ncbi:M48 family metallopeptidase [Streptomyces pluripotens]|uniref:M48 family metallopeptidase n=1 Tax=Streptomyces pluripotens TaxID=1355015 RepID=UPI000AB36E0A|nr:M48 family metallopeptidase [Streptomyces pluripotens]
MARHERLFHRVLANGTQAAPSNAALYGAIVLATAVNLVTLALTGAGVWLLAAAGTWPERILGVLALLIAVLLRPRLGRMPGNVLAPDTAPTLYEVADRISAGLGTRPVDFIAVDGRFRSAYKVVGIRRRRVLVLGLPLWESLTPDERLALLGYELAHARVGARLSGRWIQAALDALVSWADVFRPGTDEQRERHAAVLSARRWAGRSGVGMANFGEALLRPLQELLVHTVHLLHRLLSRLGERSGEQAEYGADEAAARLASARSVEGLLEALLLRETAVFALRRAARSEGDVWEELRDHMNSVPGTERARRLRLSELRGDAAGTGFPPTYLRIQFVRKLSFAELPVPVTSAESRSIDAELEPTRAVFAAWLRESI